MKMRNVLQLFWRQEKERRMHSKIQKQFLEIQGYPVLYYSLHCFQESQYDSGYYSGNK